jgi:hypothetical protein
MQPEKEPIKNGKELVRPEKDQTGSGKEFITNA